MDLTAAFTGTLHMPDKKFLEKGSPVFLATGEPVASIVWHGLSDRFEILDANGAVVAACRPEGFFRRTYIVRTADNRPVISVKQGAWRPFNGAEVTLASGRGLTIHQISFWSDRKFEINSASEGLVARVMPTTGAFSFHPDSYEFELLRPAMSALEAISLAQAMRLVARRNRQAAASGAGHVGH
jgi:hypothetical protein